MPLGAAKMDQDITMCSEVNQRERNIIRYHLQEESINLYQRTTIQNRKRLTNFENQLTINNKKKVNKGFGHSKLHLPYLFYIQKNYKISYCDRAELGT